MNGSTKLFFLSVQTRFHVSVGFQARQMWQSGCRVKVWQGGDEPEWLYLPLPRGLWPCSHPRAYTSRAGSVWGWSGHAAQHHCWTEQEDGVTKSSEVSDGWIYCSITFGSTLTCILMPSLQDTWNLWICIHPCGQYHTYFHINREFDIQPIARINALLLQWTRWHETAGSIQASGSRSSVSPPR